MIEHSRKFMYQLIAMIKVTLETKMVRQLSDPCGIRVSRWCSEFKRGAMAADLAPGDRRPLTVVCRCE
jgi:hypothetical protein